jgi:hypothetical protein
MDAHLRAVRPFRMVHVMCGVAPVAAAVRNSRLVARGYPSRANEDFPPQMNYSIQFLVVQGIRAERGQPNPVIPPPAPMHFPKKRESPATNHAPRGR